MCFRSYAKVRNGFQRQGEQHDDSFAEEQEKRSEDCLQQTAFSVCVTLISSLSTERMKNRKLEN